MTKQGVITFKVVCGWAFFVSGIFLALWLHTLRDQIAHAAIVPLFVVIWIAMLLMVWDGRRYMSGGTFYVAVGLQLLCAVGLSAWALQRMINAL